MRYAGDVGPTDAYAALQADADAVLVDVRTSAEWSYVGLPDLSQIGKRVIPLEWQAFLQPKGQVAAAVAGVNTPELRQVNAFTGVQRRNYDYDRFWVTFPLHRDDGTPTFAATDRVAELVVRIVDKEGRVEWPVAASVVSARE